MAVPIVPTVVLFEYAVGAPPWAAAAMGAGNALGPWLAARLLARSGFDPAFRGARDFRSLCAAAAAGMPVPATLGVAGLVLAGGLPAERAWGAWIGWYAGDALGVLLATPLLLATHDAWRTRRRSRAEAPRRDVLALGLVAGLIVAGLALASRTHTPYAPQGFVSMFVLQLAMASGAAWFGTVGAWSTLLSVSLAVALQLALGFGPFVRAQPDEGQWVAWLFLMLGASFAMLTMAARRRHESTQHALALREQQLRAMFEQSAAALSVSERGRYVLVNDAFCAMLGRSRGELVGVHGAEVVHPEDRHLHVEALRRQGDGRGARPPFEQRFLHADGHEVWARVATSVVRPRPDAVPQVVAVMLDVTSNKRLEASLRRQREQLALVFEATGAGIWDHDLVTGRSHYSESYLRMLGHPPEAVLRRAADDPGRLHPDDAPRVRAALDALFERRVPFDIEYRLRRADGGFLWVHGRGFAAWDETGRPIRDYGAIADVSARKAAEAALLDSRARLSAVIDSALDAIVSLDEGGRIVVFNQAAEALYGHRAVDVLGRSMMVLIPPRLRRTSREDLDRMAAIAADRSRDSAARSIRILGLHADGSEIPIDASVAAVTVADGRLMTGVLRDRRERKRIEAAETARARAEAASRAKSAFLSRMSHELRTPLNAVLGFSQLMELDDDAPLPESQRERLRSIREAGTHLGALIDELLDLTRIESDRFRLERAEVEVAPLVQACLRLVSPSAADAGIALAPFVADARTPRVLGDPVRLRQVLVNLLSNAIKYNRRGGAVRVRAEADDEGAWIEVADDGVGIAREDQPRLFEPFERLGHEHGEIEGLGIGLALSRRLVELMGGRIEVDSDRGRGSTFRVRLPCAPARTPRPAARSARDPTASAVAPTFPDRT
jgi:PAS domain S-box-containing protein